MIWAKPFYQTEPASLFEANKIIPYFQSVLRSTSRHYRDLIKMSSQINAMVKAAQPTEEFLEILETKCQRFYLLLNKINYSIKEIENLGADFSSVAQSIISVIGRRNGKQIVLSIKLGEVQFTRWRLIGQHFVHSQLITEEKEFV